MDWKTLLMIIGVTFGALFCLDALIEDKDSSPAPTSAAGYEEE